MGETRLKHVESIVEQAARLFVFTRNMAGEPPNLRKILRLGAMRLGQRSKRSVSWKTELAQEDLAAQVAHLK